MLPTTLALVLAFAAKPPDPIVRTAPSAASDRSLVTLATEVDRISQRARGVVGVRAVHLESGRTFSQNAAVRFPMHSTFKLAVALTVLHRVEEGKMKLDERVAVTENDLRPGMGTETLTERWKPGTSSASFSVGELTEFMMIESDNTAADLLIRIVGGPSAVQENLVRLGLTGIDVSRTEQTMNLDAHGVKVLPAPGTCSIACMNELIAGVSAAEQNRAREASESDPRDTATPEGMANLNVRLMKGELLGKSGTGTLLGMMRRCKTGDARIRGLLPSDTEVFDKTGTGGRSTNDVGIVTLPGGGHVALAVYVKGSRRDKKECERVIAEIARAVYRTFSEGAAPVRLERRAEPALQPRS